MKKLMTILLASMLVFSVVACGNKNQGNSDNSKNEYSQISAAEILDNVWSRYKDDEKFAAAGGDMSEENMKTDAPGQFDLGDPTALDTTLGFPASQVNKIDSAVSLMHMMNANTFTCGAFHVKNTDDVQPLCSSIKDNIMHRQWVCGFPDKLVIVTVGDNIVSFFGEKEIVDNFKSKLTAAYESAQVVCDESIS